MAKKTKKLSNLMGMDVIIDPKLDPDKAFIIDRNALKMDISSKPLKLEDIEDARIEALKNNFKPDQILVSTHQHDALVYAIEGMNRGKKVVLEEGDWVVFREGFWEVTGVHLKDYSLRNLETGQIGSWSVYNDYIKVPKGDLNTLRVLYGKEGKNYNKDSKGDIKD